MRIAKAFLDLDTCTGSGTRKTSAVLAFNPMESCDLFAEVASYDGSVGWNFCIAAAASAMVACLPLGKLTARFQHA